MINSCGCGHEGTESRCPECDLTMIPKWDVKNSRGRTVGHVYGGSENDALESVKQTPQFDRFHALSVRQTIAD